ncbi:MAG: UDP-N-acetylmuramate--L-alanine ligase [Candidatus Melainabacteria bacterium]|nr:UDP-N-acetylmuramate--L-alanine ligase [Candidatus Melainabacteria bacterium]
MKASQAQSLKTKKIHFIGIGGIGMSALARYFHAQGSFISGSDKELTNTITDLNKAGIKNIWTPHSKQNIEKINPDYVIYSTAVTLNNNEELNWAKENKKNILHRSDLLELAIRGKKTIAVSGTHGKTSTSAMITEILLTSGLDPSAILGGILLSKNSNTIIGNGEYFVIEADESDKSLLKGNPKIAVITNIEADHLENYPGGIEEIKNTFLEFAKKAISKKNLVVCLQDKITREIITKNFKLDDHKIITYGIYQKSEPTTIYAKHEPEKNSWGIYLKGQFQTSIKLKNPGEHNVLNALAAFSVSNLLGISTEKIKVGLENYTGVKRRFHILAQTNEITVIDDYAHHPTEISATIQAAKELKPKRLIVVLQPHQPRRLKDLWKEFKETLTKEENPIFVTDTYIARGNEIEGISSEGLVKEINKPNITYLTGSINKVAEYLQSYIKAGDLILIMGAGDITNLGPKLLKPHQILASNFGNN